jgi:hypothetical protein
MSTMDDSSKRGGRRHALRRLTAAALVGAGLSAEAATDSAQPAAEAASAVVATGAAPVGITLENLGVELVGVRLSASDFLIDLRYRIKDATKAQPLLEKKLQPVLVNDANGDRFYIPQVPKVGALRQSATAKQPAQPGRVYFMLFANPDRKLRSGEKVTLYVGDSVVKGLEVQ